MTWHQEMCSWRLHNIYIIKLDASKCFTTSHSCFPIFSLLSNIKCSHIQVQQVKTDKDTMVLLILLQHSGLVFLGSEKQKQTEEWWDGTKGIYGHWKPGNITYFKLLLSWKSHGNIFCYDGFKRVSLMSKICRATIALKSRACVYVEDG